MSMSRAARLLFLMSANGNNANETGMEIESRFRDRRGRPHYDDGRFAPRNETRSTQVNNRQGNNAGNYSDYGYQNGEIRSVGYTSEGDGSFRGEYNDYGTMRRMIGFGNSEMQYKGPSRDNEMESRHSQKERGYAHSDAAPPFSREMAEKWMHLIKNADGSKGPRWTLEQAGAAAKKMGIKRDPYEWWAIVNAMYSDYCEVAKHFNMPDSIDFFAGLAAAWLEDEDAEDSKAARYFTKISRFLLSNICFVSVPLPQSDFSLAGM